jgi:D-glycero-D-manno-heptose 1,7-bisphosphate phosphatase
MSTHPHRRKALFLDRDGVIDEDTGYPHKPEHIVFRPGIFEFCRSAVDMGYVIVVVTNQAGVARGRFTEADVRALHAWMGEEFRRRGVEIAGFYYCPYHPEAVLPEYRQDSAMRKPRPGMVLQAAEELGIDIDRSLMVGDKPSDRIELPELRSVIVRSGYASEAYDVERLEDVLRYLEGPGRDPGERL